MFGLVVDITRNLTASYTIDGVTQSRGIPKGAFDSVPMTEFFHAKDLGPGQHTLIVNLTDVQAPQAFGFDFIAYNSSVDSISSLPDYVPAANAANGLTSGSGRIGLGPGATAGIVIGIIVFLALLIAGIFLWRSSTRSKKGVVALGSQNASYDDIEASSAYLSINLCYRTRRSPRTQTEAAAQQQQMQQLEK